MKKIFILLLLAAGATQMFGIMPNLPPGCDTLITVDGRAYLINIKSETTREIEFRLCDDTLNTTYAVKWARIRQIRRIGMLSIPTGPAPEISPTPPPASWIRADKSLRDTCDQITLTDGKTYDVHIVDHDMFNYFYTLCDGSDDRTYIAPNRRVRSVKRSALNPKERKSNTALGCLIALLAVPVLLLLIALIGSAVG